MIKPHRQHPLWLAYSLHRLSGLGLALFLPAHFYVLGLTLNHASQLNKLFEWAQSPVFKLAEMGLIFLLAVHLFGGIRLLALEFLPWNPRQKTLASLAVATAFFVACGFLLKAL